MRGGVRGGWRVDLGGGVKVKQAVGEDAGRLRVRRTDRGEESLHKLPALTECGRSGGEALTADVGMIQRGVMAGLGCCTAGS